MRTLCKHSLPFDRTLPFYKEALEGTNLLSDELLNTISREKGHFFTLLPNHANLNNLYQFSDSILPPSPKKTGKVGSLPGIYTYSEILSINEEISIFIYEQMIAHKYLFISDHYNATYKEIKNEDFFLLYGMHYLEEIYHFLSQQQATPSLIKKCISYSNTFWHSLSILSKKPMLNNAKKSLEFSDIQEFCACAQFAFVGAYDGEGQIIWERGDTN